MLAYLGDTLLVLSAEEDGPCDAAGVLALEEQGLGLAILETEDLAVAADIDLTLQHGKLSAFLYNLRCVPSLADACVCSFNRPARSDNDADSPLVIAASTSRRHGFGRGSDCMCTFPG